MEPIPVIWNKETYKLKPMEETQINLKNGYVILLKQTNINEYTFTLHKKNKFGSYNKVYKATYDYKTCLITLLEEMDKHKAETIKQQSIINKEWGKTLVLWLLAISLFGTAIFIFAPELSRNNLIVQIYNGIGFLLIALITWKHYKKS